MRKPKIVFIDSGVAADNQMLKNETIEEIEIPNECAGESFQSGSWDSNLWDSA